MRRPKTSLRQAIILGCVRQPFSDSSLSPNLICLGGAEGANSRHIGEGVLRGNFGDGDKTRTAIPVAVGDSSAEQKMEEACITVTPSYDTTG